MPEDQGRVRLITFMGLNTPDVQPCYELGRGGHSGSEKNGGRRKTDFAGVALFDLIGQVGRINRPEQVIVLSTEKALSERKVGFLDQIRKNGLTDDIKLLFSGKSDAGVEIPFLPAVFDSDDRGSDPLWETFRILRQFMDVTAEPQADDLKLSDGALPDTIILDITHGFRITPFIAAAALVHQRMLDALRYERIKTEEAAGIATKDSRKPPRYLVYAAPDLKADGKTVIYDISRFVDMLAWTDSLGLFLRGGRLPQVKEGSCQYPADTDGGRRDAMSAFPPLSGLDADQLRTVKAFQDALADVEGDMLTMRTGDLLTGELSKGQDRQPGSAARAYEALDKARKDIRKHAPPVDSVLNELEGMLKPLALDETAVRQGLGQGAGLDAMRALSVRYLQVGRYLEALTMAVEGWTGMMAAPEEAYATDPNSPEFKEPEKEEKNISKGAKFRRDVLMHRFGHYNAIVQEKTHKGQGMSSLKHYKNIRNEINHGGFTSLDYNSECLKENFNDAVGAFHKHKMDKSDVSVARTRVKK